MRIDRTLIVFALIGGFTFCVDMVILTVTHNALHWPVPVATSAGYGTALILNFVINRTFNFHAHGHFGSQAGKFAVAVGINYVVFVLGVVSLLVHLGVEFQIARLAAAAMEGVFLYCAMRFAVFRERRQTSAPVSVREVELNSDPSDSYLELLPQNPDR